MDGDGRKQEERGTATGDDKPEQHQREGDPDLCERQTGHHQTQGTAEQTCGQEPQGPRQGPGTTEAGGTDGQQEQQVVRPEQGMHDAADEPTEGSGLQMEEIHQMVGHGRGRPQQHEGDEKARQQRAKAGEGHGSGTGTSPDAEGGGVASVLTEVQGDHHSCGTVADWGIPGVTPGDIRHGLSSRTL